jgi:hypothetical protein
VGKPGQSRPLIGRGRERERGERERREIERRERESEERKRERRERERTGEVREKQKEEAPGSPLRALKQSEVSSTSTGPSTYTRRGSMCLLIGRKPRSVKMAAKEPEAKGSLPWVRTRASCTALGDVGF